MKKAFVNKIETILTDERTQLVLKLKQQSADVVDFDGDETDEIQAKILALTSAKLIARDREKLAKIDEAFKRIKDGSFGSCEECGEDIAEKRLLFNPMFIMCIGCAEAAELMRKRGER
jgi:DnaK suppressor protein